MDELLDVYFSRFIVVLSKTNVDTSPFTKKSFTEELNQTAKKNILRNFVALKAATLESPDKTETDDVKISVIMNKTNKSYFDQAWIVVSKYVENNWI